MRKAFSISPLAKSLHDAVEIATGEWLFDWPRLDIIRVE
jgi:hypothetical protein